jgi:hypothetical protein
VQLLYFCNCLQKSESLEVVVDLGVTQGGFYLRQIREWPLQLVTSVREENLVVHVYVVGQFFLGIQGTHFLVHNSCGSLDGSIYEINVHSMAGSVSLDALVEFFSWEGLERLIFLVEISSV